VSLASMQAELRGSVPKVPFSYTKTLVNRAFRHIREANLWSFLLMDSAWASPPTVTTGAVTTTQGLATITFNAAAIIALNAASAAYSLITQRQFRIASGGIYSLIAYNAGTGAATLDRPFMEAGGAGQTYQVYQVYYSAPVKDFLTFVTVRNMSMFLNMDLTRTRQWVDMRDPQRSFYAFPTVVVPYQIDRRGDGTATPSSTLGFPLYELWGQAITPFTYQCYGIRRGVDLSNPDDALPQAIPEELVLAKAREYAYEWAEANKDMVPRASGPDFRFLMGKAQKDYKDLLIQSRREDKEFCNNWAYDRGFSLYALARGYYNTLASTAGYH
jgi:hypothetical protein